MKEFDVAALASISFPVEDCARPVILRRSRRTCFALVTKKQMLAEFILSLAEGLRMRR